MIRAMGTRIRIATWCVGGVRAKQTLLCEWLASRKPDLVALQKTFAKKKNFPRDALRNAGYASVDFCNEKADKNGWGVAVLCRKGFGKMDVVRPKGLPLQQDSGARLLTVRVGDIEFSSVYALYGNPGKFGFPGALKRKLRWMQLLRMHIGEPQKKPGMRVFAGDFNVVSEGKPKKALAYTVCERAEVQAILDAGFFDLANGPNFFGLVPGGKVKARLHRILGTKPISDQVHQAWVDCKYGGKVPVKKGALWVSSAPVVVDLCH